MAEWWFPIALGLVLWQATRWGKTYVFTELRASSSRLWWVGRATLPLHAPLLGAGVGAIPTAPWPLGIESPWAIAAGAAVGVACSWIVGAVRHAIERWPSRPSKLPPEPTP